MQGYYRAIISLNNARPFHKRRIKADVKFIPMERHKKYIEVLFVCLFLFRHT